MGDGLAASLDPGAQVLHRWVAVIVGLVIATIALAAWRTQRDRPVVLRLALLAAVLYPVQAVIGGLQVLLQLDKDAEKVNASEAGTHGEILPISLLLGVIVLIGFFPHRARTHYVA